MDTKLAVHAGAELVVVGGMFLYFNKKITILNEHNAALMKRIEQLERVFQIHDDVIGDLVSHGGDRVRPSQDGRPERNRVYRSAETRHQNVQQLGSQDNVDFRPEELDQELAQELKEELSKIPETDVKGSTLVEENGTGQD